MRGTMVHYACLPTPCFDSHICFLLAPFVFVVSLGRAENPQCTQLWTVVIWMTNNDPPNCTQRFCGALVLMEMMRGKGTHRMSNKLNSRPIGGNHPN